MDTVGITVHLSRYRATVHYERCSYYSPTYHHSKLPLPPSIKWKLCSFCKPIPEDVAEVAGEVTWLEKSADVLDIGKNRGAGMLVTLTEDVERHLAEEELYGRSNFIRDRY